MIHYIIQTMSFQVFFLLVYDVFLKKETFFNWNRLYLLATALLSIMLPFIKIERFKDVVPQQYIINLPEIFIGNEPQLNTGQIQLNPVVLESQSILSWELLFYVGMLIATLLLVFKIIKMVWLLSQNPKSKIGKLHIVKLLNSSAAFSFFNYIFLGERLSETEKDSILKHEMVHVNQKHTLDLLFFEVVRILFWFNPLVYMYQNRMTTLHEFIADEQAVKHQNKSEYYQNLLTQVFDTKNISFINPFFKQSLIKKRIVMLQKSKSKQINLFKYVLLIPMVLGMLMYTSTDAQENSVNKKEDLNLSQFNYKVNRDGENTQEQEESNKKYWEFLNSHQEYVGWAIFDEEKGEATFTVHLKTEPVPEGFEKNKIKYPDGTTSFSYARFTKVSKQKNKNLSIEDKIQRTPLLEKIHALKEQIQVQGNTNGDEEHGLNLLLKLAKSNTLNESLIKEVQAYCILKNKTPLMDRISDVFNQIQAQGEVTNEEEKVLKELLVFTSDGFNDPFFNDVIQDIDLPFAVIDEVPVYPGCESLTTNDERKKCMSNEISMFVNKNFNTKIGKENGLVGRQRINVIFKIDNQGNIVDVRSRAPHPALEAEAIRVIKTLPKMIPGKQKGKAVNVPYSLPIIFQVADEKPSEQKE